MDLLVVGVGGHQKALENSKTLMKIDVFLCLVVQVPGFYRGGGAPPFYRDWHALTQESAKNR